MMLPAAPDGRGVLAWRTSKELFLFQCGMSIFVNLNHMNDMDITIKHPSKEYEVPAMRMIDTRQDVSFLASNLEPIGGGDDPEIDW